MSHFRGLVFVCLFFVPTAARAGFLVSVGSLTLQPGQQGLIDVNITSDSSDTLAGFLVSYEISASGLEFFTVAPNEPDDLQLTNLNYVFFGNSSAVNSNTPAGTIATNNFTNDTYSGLDTPGNGVAVLVPSTTGTRTLITTLHVVATTAVAGDSFTISVDEVNSFFDDASFTPVAFTSSTGKVEISNIPAIPEPSSLVLAISAIITVGLIRRIARCSRKGSSNTRDFR